MIFGNGTTFSRNNRIQPMSAILPDPQPQPQPLLRNNRIQPINHPPPQPVPRFQVRPIQILRNLRPPPPIPPPYRPTPRHLLGIRRPIPPQRMSLIESRINTAIETDTPPPPPPSTYITSDIMNSNIERFRENNHLTDWEPNNLYHTGIEGRSDPVINRVYDYTNPSPMGGYERVDKDDNIEEIYDKDDIIEIRNRRHEDLDSLLTGSGIFKRDPYKFSPKVRQFLLDHGHETIQSITLFKYPLKNLSKITSFFSKGKSVSFDSVYHLGMHINDSYIIDKDAVWNMKQAPYPTKDKNERIVVKFKNKITINECINDTIMRVGKDRFYKYTALQNNCQRAVMDLLNTLQVEDSKTVKSFVLQDMDELISNLPSISGAISDGVNSVKEFLSRQIDGEGSELKGSGTNFKISY